MMKRTPKTKLITLPKKVIPFAELSTLEVVLALKIPSTRDFLNKSRIKNTESLLTTLLEGP